MDDILRVLLYILVITFGLCATIVMLEMIFEVVFEAVLKVRAHLTLKMKLRKAKRMSDNGQSCINCLYSHKVKGSSCNTCDRTLKKTPVFSETAGVTYELSSELAKYTYATRRCKWAPLDFAKPTHATSKRIGKENGDVV